MRIAGWGAFRLVKHYLLTTTGISDIISAIGALIRRRQIVVSDQSCGSKFEKELRLPRGPNGERRPADAIGRAVMVAKLATGEISESLSPTHVERARMGGQARMAALSGEQRSEIAKRAAGARWNLKEASMNNADCAILADLYKRKAAAPDGLVDVKFFVGNVGEAVKEIVCGEVLRLERAIESGDVFPLDFDDRH